MAPSGSHLRAGELGVRGQGLDSVPLPMGIHVPDVGRLNLGSWDPLQSLQFRALSGCWGIVSRERNWEGMSVSGRQKTPGGRNGAALRNSCGLAPGEAPVRRAFEQEGLGLPELRHGKGSGRDGPPYLPYGQNIQICLPSFLLLKIYLFI